jgi:hypothetical protein
MCIRGQVRFARGDSIIQRRSDVSGGEYCGNGSCGVVGTLAPIGIVAEVVTAPPAVGTLPSG